MLGLPPQKGDLSSEFLLRGGGLSGRFCREGLSERGGGLSWGCCFVGRVCWAGLLGGFVEGVLSGDFVQGVVSVVMSGVVVIGGVCGGGFAPRGFVFGVSSGGFCLFFVFWYVCTGRY